MKYLKPLKMIKDLLNKDLDRTDLWDAIVGINNPDNLKKIINVIGEDKYRKAYDFFSRISKTIKNTDFDYIKDRFVDIEDKYDHETLLKFCLHMKSEGIIEIIENTDPNVIMKLYLRRYTRRSNGFWHEHEKQNLDIRFGILVSISTKTENNLINWKECSDDIMKFYESIKSVIDYSHIEMIDEVNEYSCRSIIYLNF